MALRRLAAFTLAFIVAAPLTLAAQVQINDERLTYWRSVGAQPSETLERLLKRKTAAASAAPAPKK